MINGIEFSFRFSVWQSVHKLTIMALFISCLVAVAPVSPAIAQTQRIEEDGAQLNELLGLIHKRQILLRAVFDKIPTSPKSFATAVSKRRQEIQASAGLTNTVGRQMSFERDEEWSRELVNLEQPQLRYDSKVPRTFTALESTTILLNKGRTITYLEESAELFANYSIGLLYDADKVDSKNWRYVYKADAHSSKFVNSDGKPPQEDPNPDGKPSVDSFAKNNRIKGFFDRNSVTAELDRISVRSANQFAPMNEILVGLSMDALKGVYFAATAQGKSQDGLEYITFQAISRRQLVRKYLSLNLPLIQVPYPSSGQDLGVNADENQIIPWSLSEQMKFLDYMSSKTELPSWQLDKITELKAKLDAEIQGN